MYKFKLYTISNTLSSKKAVTSLTLLLDGELKARYSLEIIDILEDPQVAISEDIFATPTLVKVLPPPSKRIVGDFSDREKVLVGLNLLN